MPTLVYFQQCRPGGIIPLLALPARGGGEPSGKLADAIDSAFGLCGIQKPYRQSAINNPGSGWTWLVKNKDGTLSIINTSNAGCPLTEGKHHY